MNHLGLFEGIGGFSLAARWMGWKTVGWVEINPFCQKVLKHHFPEAQGFSDIKKFSYATYKSILRNRGIKDRRVDIITGGFPCQPYSSAGLRKGTDDPRHLWPNMLETIRQFKPTWVVGENVRGITNWNGGLVFEQVQTDLEAIGYEVQAFILPACSVNAPHRRDRVWFVAHRSDSRTQSVQRKRKNSVYEPEITPNPKSDSPVRLSIRTETQHAVNGEHGHHGLSTYSDSFRRIQSNSKPKPRQPAKEVSDWERFPTQSPLCGRNDGLSTRLVGITFPRHRRESIQAYGNAIVPQVAYQIFKSINEHEQKIQQ